MRATYLSGRVLLNVGRVDEAAAAIQRALALDPNAGEALAQRAIIQVVQNRKAEALADARRAVELSPDSSAARIALSYALQANFQLEEARAVLREAVERNPEDALAWARLAELEQMFGELGASRDAAERAVALAPELARTQMVLGFAALTRIDIEPGQGRVRARDRAGFGQPAAAPRPRVSRSSAAAISRTGGKEIEIAAALDPNDSLIRSYLGKAYFEEKRDPSDAEQYAIAKELDPNDPTPWFYDAIRLQTENRPVEALRNIEKSIELNDNRAVYRSRLLLDEDLATRGASLGADLRRPRLRAAGRQRGGAIARARSGQLGRAPLPLGPLCRRAPARGRAGQRAAAAQLLQPVGLNPIQPSLAFTDLNVVPAGGRRRSRSTSSRRCSSETACR